MPTDIFQAIEAAKAGLTALKPLSGAALRGLEDWYDVNLTYSSNALEGNTLTRNETAIVIEKGITVRGKPLKDHNEAVDHYAAVKFMRSLARDDRAIGEAEIRQLHQLTVATTVDTAGRYATRARFVNTSTGEHRFPAPADIPPLMADFAARLPAAPDAEAAFRAHLEFIAIHPFEDGNGRTARLLMNALLLRGGYVPLMIDPAQRPDYIDAIEAHQTGGDAEVFLALMGGLLLTEIDGFIRRVSEASPPDAETT